jgi:hypothetical protein
MPILVKKKFNVHAAQQFKESFAESDPSQLYLFYSRIDPWQDDNSPPAQTDTQYTERDVWRGMTALKKISNNSVTMAATKYEWATGTVYTEYSDTNPDLASSNFYVVTSNNEVYKLAGQLR